MSEKGIKMPHQIELKLLAIEMSEKGIKIPHENCYCFEIPKLVKLITFKSF